MRRLVLASALSAACALALVAAPASAHGVCSTTVSDYTYSGSATSGNFHWSGKITCTELHYSYYVRACLERLDYSYSPPQFWEVSCAEATEPSQVLKLSVDGNYSASATNPCVPGTYRTYAVGSAGTTGTHWNVPYAYGPPHLELCNAV